MNRVRDDDRTRALQALYSAPKAPQTPVLTGSKIARREPISLHRCEEQRPSPHPSRQERIETPPIAKSMIKLLYSMAFNSPKHNCVGAKTRRLCPRLLFLVLSHILVRIDSPPLSVPVCLSRSPPPKHIAQPRHRPIRPPISASCIPLNPHGLGGDAVVLCSTHGQLRKPWK